MSSRSHHWILLAVLFVAAILRFYRLPARGLLYWDESKFALEGVRVWSFISSLPSMHPALAGKAIGTAKPTHALFIAVAYGFLGIRDYAPLLLNATASVLQVAVLFLWGRQLIGIRAALVASLFLAVSGYDIIYARSALSEGDANLFFLIGAFLWWRGRENYRGHAVANTMLRLPFFYSGALIGVAFTTNYRLVVYIVTFVTIDLVASWRRDGWRKATVATTAGMLGLILAPVLWQVLGTITQAHGMVLFGSESTHHPTSYGAEILSQIHGRANPALRPSPLPYAQWYVVRQGWVLSLLLLVGLFRALTTRSYHLVLPAMMVLVPFSVYMFAPVIVPRSLDASLPFAALLSAAALEPVAQRIARHRNASRLLMLTVLIGALSECARVWPLTTVRSGFPSAASYVRQRGGEGALVVNEVMRFYLRDSGAGCDAPTLPKSIAGLRGVDGAGDYYAVIDQYSRPAAQYLARRAKLVAHFPALSGTPMGDNLIASENGVPPLSEPVGQIDVYALESLQLVDVNQDRIWSCSLDQLALNYRLLGGERHNSVTAPT